MLKQEAKEEPFGWKRSVTTPETLAIIKKEASPFIKQSQPQLYSHKPFCQTEYTNTLFETHAYKSTVMSMHRLGSVIAAYANSTFLTVCQDEGVIS